MIIDSWISHASCFSFVKYWYGLIKYERILSLWNRFVVCIQLHGTRSCTAIYPRGTEKESNRRWKDVYVWTDSTRQVQNKVCRHCLCLSECNMLIFVALITVCDLCKWFEWLHLLLGYLSMTWGFFVCQVKGVPSVLPVRCCHTTLRRVSTQFERGILLCMLNLSFVLFAWCVWT